MGFGNSGGGPTRPKGHIYVPMPGSPVYGNMNKREQLIKRYGEVSVMHAEVAACVTIMTAVGVIKKEEFVELVENALKAADIRRQRHAESGGREG